MDSGRLLAETMAATRTSQSALALLSGVRQPSISQMLHGKIALSDAMLDRLLACMGFQLEITRRATPVDLHHAALRRWRMHQRLVAQLDSEHWAAWRPRVVENLSAIRSRFRGEPHLRNITRWEQLVTSNDLAAIRRVANGLDADSIAMREVSPLGGLLSQTERRDVLEEVRQWTARN